MSLRTLDFDSIHLSCSAGNLSLVVVACADFNLPSETVSFVGKQSFEEAIASMLWVPRACCRLNLRFSCNGCIINSEGQLRDLEALGTYIRDLSLWKQLSVLASLEISQVANGPESQPQISLLLRPEDSEQPCQILQPSNWSTQSHGLRAPRSIPIAEFRQMQIDFQLSSVLPYRTRKNKKVRLDGHEILDSVSICGVDSYTQLDLGNQRINDDDMLLSRTHSTISQSDEVACHDENEMLLRQSATSSFPWSTSPARPPATLFSSLAPLKRPPSAAAPCSNTITSLTSPRACQLYTTALQLLIAGSHSRSLRGLPTISLNTPPSTSVNVPRPSFSTLIPSIFNPTFYRAMQSNARFIPIISTSIIAAWPQHVQSPSLRRKLVELSRVRTALSLGSEFPVSQDSKDHKKAENEDISERLAQVVQARLWGMMHRRLYDPAAARKIRADRQPESANWGAHNGASHAPEAFCDLLNEPDGTLNEGTETRDFGTYEQWTSRNTEGDDNLLRDDSDMDSFEDLFTGEYYSRHERDTDNVDAYGMETNLAAQDVAAERWQIERDTEEMLLGPDFDSDFDFDFGAEDEICRGRDGLFFGRADGAGSNEDRIDGYDENDDYEQLLF